MVGGAGDPFYLKFWVNRTPLEALSKMANFEPILARSASAVTPIPTFGITNLRNIEQLPPIQVNE